jgi:pyruvate formate lyase activating enzyme
MVDGKICFDSSACDLCDACIEACPISANPMVRQYSVDDILDLVRQHRPFLSGITVSGGEPTQQMKFIIELFTAIKSADEFAGLTCFIDSNGHLGAANWEKLLPLTDGVMLDIKAFDERTHENLTGKSNNRSLRSARILQAAGKLHEIRFLLIPDKTDVDEEVDQLIDFVVSLGPDTRVKLNAFRHHGVKGEALDWETMPQSGVDKTAQRLRAAGINNVITPAVYV